MITAGKPSSDNRVFVQVRSEERVQTGVVAYLSHHDRRLCCIATRTPAILLSKSAHRESDQQWKYSTTQLSS